MIPVLGRDAQAAAAFSRSVSIVHCSVYRDEWRGVGGMGALSVAGQYRPAQESLNWPVVLQGATTCKPRSQGRSEA